MMKIKPYLLPLLILIVGSLLIIIGVYQNLDFVYNKDKSIALMISAFGLLFALFQVVLNNELQNMRNVNSLRHTEYKEFVKLSNSISNTITDNMLVDEMKVEALFTSLLNFQNDFVSFMNSNNTYLFKGMDNNKALNETLDILKKLIDCTDIYRSYREKTKEMEGGHLMLQHMKWHNEMRDLLIEYHSLRHEAAKELQKYILH